MNRAMIFAVAVAVSLIASISIGAFLYWQGGKQTRAKANETKLIKEKDISDAVKDSDAAPAWRDELRDRHK